MISGAPGFSAGRSDRRYGKIYASISVIILSTILNAGQTRAESIPLPAIDSAIYCKALVGKMLDPGEQDVEYTKCMNQEARSEKEAKPFWNSLTEKQQKDCLRYFTAPEFTSYLALQGCMSSAIGFACMRGTMTCQAVE